MVGLFGALFVPDALAEATSDGAWLEAMLEVESALAAVEARAGVIPSAAATAIAHAAQVERFDIDELGRAGRASGNPVVPLVRALREALPQDAASFVHWGATSQDILDTAAMLVTRRALDLIVAEIDAVASACAALAGAHRTTVMAGRTLLQQALPVTFGLKAAGWLVAVDDARARLVSLRADGLAVQLGGGAGTLASLGAAGEVVLHELAAELALAEPVVPWHTARGRIAELGAALAVAAGALGKVALDVVLLAQTEVSEVSEAAGPGRGGSSTMPHKRNPVAAIRALACAQRLPTLAGGLLAAMAHEHERAAGAWHAEWQPLGDALALTGGAAACVRESLEGLELDRERMRANLDLTGGAPMAERVTLAVAEHADRDAAHAAVAGAIARAADGTRSLREELLAEPLVREHLSPAGVDRALDPETYLGCADAFIERALRAHAVRGEA